MYSEYRLKLRVMTTVICLLLLAACTVKPKILTVEENDTLARDRLSRVTAGQVKIDKPVTLYEAMARAILYNLDAKVEDMERSLRIRDLKLASLNMLPQLVANAGWTGRDGYSASRSVGVSNIDGRETLGAETLQFSTSSQRNNFTADISLGWDVLDFGLSYVRSRQAADQVMIAMENKRVVINRVIEDVRSAYWRAVSAERTLEAMSELKAQVEDALHDSQRLLERKRVAPMSALNTQRDLLSTLEELNSLQQELNIAKHQLAALMNLDPGVEYQIALPDQHEVSLPKQVSAAQMINIALRNRPELREVTYQQRINKQQAKANLLEMFPSLRFHADYQRDGNDFLFSQDWLGWGARASWNLMEVFRYPAKKMSVEAQQKLLDQRALAITMAVMTQVHVARTRLAYTREIHLNAEKFRSVQHKIMGQVQAGFNSGRLSRHTLLRERMNTIVSEVKHDIAVAKMQNSFANVYAAVGLDAYAPQLKGTETLEELQSALSKFWKSRGDSHISYGSRSGLAGILR